MRTNAVVILVVSTMVVGTIQGQSDVVLTPEKFPTVEEVKEIERENAMDNSPFGWVSVSTCMDGQKGNANLFVGKHYGLWIEGDAAGAKEDWKEFLCFFDGGIILPSFKFTVWGEQRVLRREGGEENVSFFAKVILSRGEEGKVLRVNSYQRIYDLRVN
ncbi:MAG: hypothetical protein Q8N69_00615 [bacterium]|nr:hypothetical protein [bacterium]